MEKDFPKKGLTDKEAHRRLFRFGPNELKKRREYSDLKLLLGQFKSPLVYILVFAGLVTLFLRDFTDAIIIFAAVILNTGFGFYQEFKAQKSLAALRSLLVPKAKVIRDGKQKIIDASQLVPGDLVVLAIGDQMPADGVLIEATDLTVNEAILTGESMPVKKSASQGKTSDGVRKHPSEVEELASGKENQVFMGTIVVTGIGKMVVNKTGMETQMGKIGKAVEEVEEEKTPLQVQLGKLAKILAIVVGIITVLIFIIGKLRGYGLLEMFTTSVAVAVAAIPEGLVVTLTAILALGMQRILRRKAIVRRLLAAETLGSVSCICADKTGTLTEGKMQVVKTDTTDENLLLKAAVLCNDMRDPLEEAMMRWSEEQLSNEAIEQLRNKHPRIDEIPFSPQTKIIATLHKLPGTSDVSACIHPGGVILFVSGAPEVVLEKSNIKKQKAKIWMEKFEEYGEKGYRLVGFAWKEIHPRGVSPRLRGPSTSGVKIENLEWLGILVYEDPVREGVREVLKECQEAGIKVKVITGDYLPTALAVLEKLGLDGWEHALTGDELEKMSAEELKKKVGEIVLFARTDPQQKLKIVKALKENGEVVAMMGDGVNDAPALAKADIGIVVGEASDVARETADMVLLDSNFATIVHAVEEGRNIFENIKKVVLYLLSDSFTEIILIGGSLLLRLPLPVTAAQILWVNLVEDTLPGIALAFEPGEKEVMEELPRERGVPILDLELKTLIFIIGISTDLILLALFYWLLKGLFRLHHIQTVMFVALGINSLFYVFACRTFRKTIFAKNPLSNPFLIFSVGVGFLLLLLPVYLPALRLLMRTDTLEAKEWLVLFSLGLFNLLAIEITKWAFIVRRKVV